MGLFDRQRRPKASSPTQDNLFTPSDSEQVEQPPVIEDALDEIEAALQVSEETQIESQSGCGCFG